VPDDFQGLNASEAIIAFDRLSDADALYGEWWPGAGEQLYACTRRVERLMKRSLYFFQAKGIEAVLFITHCVSGRALLQLLDPSHILPKDPDLGSLSQVKWEGPYGRSKLIVFNKKTNL
jgi:broad specificity phosphatase PhoE